MSKLPGAEVQRGIWSSSEARAPGSEPLSFLTVQGVIFGSLDQVCVCVWESWSSHCLPSRLRPKKGRERL